MGNNKKNVWHKNDHIDQLSMQYKKMSKQINYNPMEM